MPPGFVPEGYNNTEPFHPIATNGQPFPWLHPYLPNNVRPNRYMLTIHPNLTTFDVKGNYPISLLCTHLGLSRCRKDFPTSYLRRTAQHNLKITTPTKLVVNPH